MSSVKDALWAMDHGPSPSHIDRVLTHWIQLGYRAMIHVDRAGVDCTVTRHDSAATLELSGDTLEDVITRATLEIWRRHE